MSEPWDVRALKLRTLALVAENEQLRQQRDEYREAAIYEKAQKSPVRMAEKVIAANARVTELEEALATLIEDAEDMRSYVPEIFQEKWGHKKAIDKARAVLHPEEAPE